MKTSVVPESAKQNGLYWHFWNEIISRSQYKNKPALVGNPNMTLTFHELHKTVVQFAFRLKQKCMKLEQQKKKITIGVYLGSCEELIITYLAIIYNGYVFCPVATSTPKAQTLSLFERVGVSMVIYAQEEPEFAEGSQLESVHFSQLSHQHFEETESIPLEPPRIDSALPAHLIFTSATTTGNPKAIVCDQYSSLHSHISRADRMPFHSKEVVGCNLFGIWDAVYALIHGVAITMLPDRLMTDVEMLAARISEIGVSRLMLTPSLAKRFNKIPRDLMELVRGSLKHVVFCGEVAHHNVLESTLFNLGPGSSVMNLYSISECADVAVSVATYDDVIAKRQDREEWGALRPLGEVKVLITQSKVGPGSIVKPIACNMTGNLLVSGPGLGIAYHNDDVSTTLNFPTIQVQQQGSQQPENLRVFVTNDKCKQLNDSNEFLVLGRFESAAYVKALGFTISLADVESAVLSHCPFLLSDCAALLANLDEDSPVLSVVVVPQSWPPPTGWKRNLKAALAQSLPASHVPSGLLAMQNGLPTKLGSGKREDKKLKLLVEQEYRLKCGTYSITDESLTLGSMSEHSKLTNALAKAMCDVLAVQVQGSDSFFDLGGNSLLLMDFLARVNAELNVHLRVSQLLQCPTPQSISHLLLSKPSVLSSQTRKCQAQRLVQDIYSLVEPGNPAVQDILPRAHSPEGSSLPLVTGSHAAPKDLQGKSGPRSALVIGAAGWVGSALVQELLRRSIKVFAVTRQCNLRKSYVELVWSRHSVRLSDVEQLSLVVVRGDTRHPGVGLASPLPTIDVVYHCAGSVNSLADYESLRSTNVVGAANVLNWIRGLKSRQGYSPKLVHLSSSAALPPRPPHGVAAAELPSDDPAKGWQTSPYFENEWFQTTTGMKAPTSVDSLAAAMVAATDKYQGTYAGYAMSKFVADQLVARANVPYTIVRPSAIRPNVVNIFTNKGHASLKVVDALATALVLFKSVPMLPPWAYFCCISLRQLSLQLVDCFSVSNESCTINAVNPGVWLKSALASVEQRWCTFAHAIGEDDNLLPVQRIQFKDMKTKLKEHFEDQTSYRAREWRALLATPFGIEGVFGMCEYPLEPPIGAVSVQDEFVDLVINAAKCILEKKQTSDRLRDQRNDSH